MPTQRYGFTFNLGHSACADLGNFVDDAAAIEYARRAMGAAHLKAREDAVQRKKPVRLVFWRRDGETLTRTPGDGEPPWAVACAPYPSGVGRSEAIRWRSIA
jgi:hypothetical protein